MFSKIIETTENPHITIEECLGDFTIQGTENVQVVVKTSDEAEDANIVQEAETLVIRTRGDLRMICPVGATLFVEIVRGDLRASDIHGSVTVGEVNGDANFRNTGALTVTQVHGDLRAQHVEGDVLVESVAADARIQGVEGNVQVQSVASDARIRDVSGQVIVQSVGSDLKAEGLMQGLIADSVGSDVKLSPPFAVGQSYVLHAGNDLKVKLPEDPNLSFRLQTSGGVHTNVPDFVLDEEDGIITGTLGEGETIIEAQVGGRVKLSAFGENLDPDFDIDIDLSFLDALDEISPLIDARVAEAMSELDVRLQEGLSFLESDRFRLHIERAAEKASRVAAHAVERAREVAEREAERAAKRARRTAEHEAERARLRAEHAERRWQRASGHRPPTPPTPSPAPAPAPAPMPAAMPAAPKPPAPSVDDKRDERLKVLQMVEEGKITSEDAANLLAALR